VCGAPRVGFWWDNRRNEGPTTTASFALAPTGSATSKRPEAPSDDERAVPPHFIYVPFNERPADGVAVATGQHTAQGCAGFTVTRPSLTTTGSARDRVVILDGNRERAVVPDVGGRYPRVGRGHFTPSRHPCNPAPGRIPGASKLGGSLWVCLSFTPVLPKRSGMVTRISRSCRLRSHHIRQPFIWPSRRSTRLTKVERDDGTHPAAKSAVSIIAPTSKSVGGTGPVRSRAGRRHNAHRSSSRPIPIMSICRAVLESLLGHSAICPCTEL